MYIGRELLGKLVAEAPRGPVGEKVLAMLWLVSYWFLLRLPSEALRMARGGPGVELSASIPSSLSLDEQALAVPFLPHACICFVFWSKPRGN